MQFLLYCFDFIFYPELIEEERIREDESYKQVLKNTKILLLLHFDKAVGFRKTLIEQHNCFTLKLRGNFNTTTHVPTLSIDTIFKLIVV